MSAQVFGKLRARNGWQTRVIVDAVRLCYLGAQCRAAEKQDGFSSDLSRYRSGNPRGTRADYCDIVPQNYRPLSYVPKRFDWLCKIRLYAI
jgi:hypothetical protein